MKQLNKCHKCLQNPMLVDQEFRLDEVVREGVNCDWIFL